MNKPYIILGTYRSKGKTCKEIGRDLVRITEKCGLKPFKNNEIKRNRKAAWSSYDLHAEVRKTAVAGSEAESFHSDGDTTVSREEMNFCMVVWASSTPTEILYNGQIYQPKPYEIVLFKNLSAQHRRPKNCPPKRRMFRQRVKIPSRIELP